MTPSIYFIVLVIVLGTLALGWSFYRRQQFKPAIELGHLSRSVSLPGKHMPALRTRLGSVLVALSFAGLSLLLGPHPHALAASAQKFTNLGTTLMNGQYLTNGQYLVSANGKYFAIMQQDGNFVIYKGSGPSDNQGAIWATHTNIPGQPDSNYFAIMQSDANFCIYHGTGPSNNLGALWCSGTNGTGDQGSFAQMQYDGNLVLYEGPTIQDPSYTGGTYTCAGGYLWSAFPPPSFSPVSYCTLSK